MSEFVTDTCTYTKEEIDACKETRRLLLLQGMEVGKISPRELLICTINCKLDPNKSALKYTKWLQSLSEFGISTFDDVWDGLGRDGSGSEWYTIAPLFNAYCGSGVDKQNRRVMWVKARHTTTEEELLQIKAGIIYFSAIHADFISLRNGITFVIDTSSADITQRVGNEAKMQRAKQSFPLRPQKILILGAGYVKRIIINGIIGIASLFTSDKVIERVTFAVNDDVYANISVENVPVYYGGGGGGIDTNEQLVDFVRRRLKAFPVLPDELL